jgi:hypothetical protein
MNPLLSMVHLFVADDARAEVRVLGEQVLIGRSAKPATLARMIERGDGHGNVYVTLNPLRPELPDRPLGPLGRGQQAATDADVMRYRWLPIDLDARAAHAERRPATAAERDAVAAVANALTSYLVTELRWPAPVVGDSGNGTWLLFPIDVPTGARVLIESTLKTLGRRVGTEAVTIDPVVGNPSRIVRAFGTVNRRAQRRSRLVAMPVRDDVLTVRDLERVQEEAEGHARDPDPEGEWYRVDDPESSWFARVNQEAMKALAGWVPTLFGDRAQPYHGGYRVPSRDLGRPLEEDLSITPESIKDFGVHDLGDARQGKRTPVDIVVEWGPRFGLAIATTHEAAQWLADQLELPGPPPAPSRRSRPDGEAREAVLPVEDPAVYYGLAGEIVGAIRDQTEAHPMAVLAHVLGLAGNLVGRQCYARVGLTRHPAADYFLIVGRSSHGRKGEAASGPRGLFHAVDPVWASERQEHGLSSAEGLVYAVRDSSQEVNKETGEPVDPGVADKRLFILEPEYAAVLKRMMREGNALSGELRNAWDGYTLGTLIKHKRNRATATHISVVGHITESELKRYLDVTEMCNGFMNRHLVLLVHRVQTLPHGGALAFETLKPFVPRLREVLQFASVERMLVRDAEARAAWETVYPTLTRDRPGLVGDAQPGRGARPALERVARNLGSEPSHHAGPPPSRAGLRPVLRGECGQHLRRCPGGSARGPDPRGAPPTRAHGARRDHPRPARSQRGGHPDHASPPGSPRGREGHRGDPGRNGRPVRRGLESYTGYDIDDSDDRSCAPPHLSSTSSMSCTGGFHGPTMTWHRVEGDGRVYTHERTLIAKLGFADADRQHPEHDLAARYLSEPQQALAPGRARRCAAPEAGGRGHAVHHRRNLPLSLLAQDRQCVLLPCRPSRLDIGVPDVHRDADHDRPDYPRAADPQGRRTVPDDDRIHRCRRDLQLLRAPVGIVPPPRLQAGHLSADGDAPGPGSRELAVIAAVEPCAPAGHDDRGEDHADLARPAAPPDQAVSGVCGPRRRGSSRRLGRGHARAVDGRRRRRLGPRGDHARAPAPALRGVHGSLGGL